jgi:hypothetical protein
MTIDELRRRLDGESAAMATARAAVAAGQDIALDDLQSRIAALCRDVEAMPRTEARPLVDDVQRLVAALDELAAAIWTAVRRNPEARIFPFQLGRP